MKVLTNFGQGKSKIGGISKHIDALTQVIIGDRDFELVGVSTDFEIKRQKSEVVTNNCKKISLPLYDLDINKAFRSRTLKGFRTRLEKQIKALRKVIENEKPDLIMLNGTYWYPWILMEAASYFEIPIIHYYAGSLKRETTEFPATTKRMFLELEKSFARDNILEHIFPSELALKSVEENVFANKLENVRVVHNGINVKYKFDRKTVPFSVGLIGRWTSVKNFEFIFDLFETNKQENGNIAINLVTDIKENNTKYKKLLKVCNLHEPMDFKYLGNFYNENSVVICPSHFETFGNVALEALSHGIPVLVSKNMGVAEVFHELGLGDWVIDFSDTQKVYEKIVTLQGVSVSPEVVERIKMEYSFETVYQTYLNIFRSYKPKVLNKNPS